VIWDSGSSWFMLSYIRAIPPPSLQVFHHTSYFFLPVHLC